MAFFIPEMSSTWRRRQDEKYCVQGSCYLTHMYHLLITHFRCRHSSTLFCVTSWPCLCFRCVFSWVSVSPFCLFELYFLCHPILVASPEIEVNFAIGFLSKTVQFKSNRAKGLYICIMSYLCSRLQTHDWHFPQLCTPKCTNVFAPSTLFPRSFSSCNLWCICWDSFPSPTNDLV